MGSKMSIAGGSLKFIGQPGVEWGELRGADGVGKGTRVVPMIGGEEIKSAEGESKDARLEREKETAEEQEKATREEFEAFKKNV